MCRYVRSPGDLVASIWLNQCKIQEVTVKVVLTIDILFWKNAPNSDFGQKACQNHPKFLARSAGRKKFDLFCPGHPLTLFSSTPCPTTPSQSEDRCYWSLAIGGGVLICSPFIFDEVCFPVLHLIKCVSFHQRPHAWSQVDEGGAMTCDPWSCYLQSNWTLVCSRDISMTLAS